MKIEKSNLDRKVRRFIELSTRFEKSEKEIFGDIGDTSGYSFNAATGVSSIYIGGGIMTPNYMKELCKTRSEKIKEKAELDAKLADEYDEYRQLQKELSEYYEALGKINN